MENVKMKYSQLVKEYIENKEKIQNYRQREISQIE
jgi:hypothetical protein